MRGSPVCRPFLSGAVPWLGVDEHEPQSRQPGPQELLDQLRAAVYLAHVSGGGEVAVDDRVYPVGIDIRALRMVEAYLVDPRFYPGLGRDAPYSRDQLPMLRGYLPFVAGLRFRHFYVRVHLQQTGVLLPDHGAQSASQVVGFVEREVGVNLYV